MAAMLQFTDETGAAVSIEPEAFIIAGYTGRDRAMVQKHIDELAHEGIAPPPEVPMWYEMPLEILATGATIAVPSAQTSGEVEPVLIGDGDALYLGIGSDHTDRGLERDDIARSKRVCPKPLGARVLRIAAPGPALDALTLASRIDDEPYQQGTFAQITSLATLLDGFRARNAARRFVLFCGTVPLLTHGFRFGRRFDAQIGGGALREPLTLSYELAGVRAPVEETP